MTKKLGDAGGSGVAGVAVTEYRQRTVVSLAILGVYGLLVAGYWVADGRVTWTGVGLVVGGALLSRQPNITLSAAGISIRNRTAPWSSVQLTEKRWTTVLSTDANASRFSRTNVPLRFYASQWRDSPLGADIARFAPHLVGQPAISRNRAAGPK